MEIVGASDIENFIQQAPMASAATVLTQKWAALFMQKGNEGWAEYRRTGYPGFLVKAGDEVLERSSKRTSGY